MDYAQYLQSDHWKEVRLKRLKIDENACAICKSKNNLNVHHISYKNLGNEDVETDLITLCHPCHAMLHRVKVQSQEQYESFLNATEYKDFRKLDLWKKITDLMLVEIWLRDKANGGDVTIWTTGGGMVGKLKSIAKMLYPDVNFSKDCLYADTDFKDTLRLARAMKICEIYREDKSISSVAQKMNMKPSNVQKVLKRHGFNAFGKIK